MKDVAANVVVIRARRKFSQAALADRAGISRASLSSYERGEGNPTLDILERIAAALDADLLELFVRDSGDAPADDAEIERRIASAETDPRSNVDARDLLAAVDEAAGHRPERYSRAGRPVSR